MLKDNTTLPFDAGYAAMFIRPTWTTSAVDVPRFPDAKAAILYTGVHFGGITGGPTSTSGLRELNTDAMGNLYGQGTALGTRQLKHLPNITDAPQVLSELPDLPRNDPDALRANFTKGLRRRTARNDRRWCALTSKDRLLLPSTPATGTRSEATDSASRYKSSIFNNY